MASDSSDTHNTIVNNIDREYLTRKIEQAEELAGRKVSYVVFNPAEADKHFAEIKPADLFPLWNNQKSEITLNHSGSTGT